MWRILRCSMRILIIRLRPKEMPGVRVLILSMILCAAVLFSGSVVGLEARPESPCTARLAAEIKAKADADSLIRQGRYLEALPLAEEAFAAAQRAHGRGSPAILPALDRVGRLYRLLWKPAEGEAALKLALSIRDASGGDPLDTASTLQELALLYCASARYAGSGAVMDLQSLYYTRWQYARALPLLRLSLKIRTERLGEESSGAAETINALGDLHGLRLEFTQAEELIKKALAIRQKIGSESAGTAESLNSLAKLHMSQLHFKEAEPLYQRALEIRMKELGEDHPFTAQTQNDLAELHLAETEFQKAEPLLRKALASRERALGVDHPDTTVTVKNLAELYGATGRYGEAEMCRRRILTLQEIVTGPDSAETASALLGCAQAAKASGKPGEAMAYYRRALAAWERILGPGDRWLAVLIEEMIDLARNAGWNDEVKKLEERLRSVRAGK
jgi:tetratricopeptide (TPR) repeat protein